MKGFMEFLRTQGVVGLAVGFIIGAGAQDFVKAFSTDILNPVVGVALGGFGDLATASSTVAGMTFSWGHFLLAFINLLILALVVYFAVKLLKADRWDAPKN